MCDIYLALDPVQYNEVNKSLLIKVLIQFRNYKHKNKKVY